MSHGPMPPPVEKAWKTDRARHRKMSSKGGKKAGEKRRIVKEDREEARQFVRDDIARELTDGAVAASVARNEHVIDAEGQPGPFPDGQIRE